MLALHRIRFSSITPEERKQIMMLQKELPKLQSLICEKKKSVWNNTHKLKTLIKNCGSKGRKWFWRNLLNKEKKYGRQRIYHNTV